MHHCLLYLKEQLESEKGVYPLNYACVSKRRCPSPISCPVARAAARQPPGLADPMMVVMARRLAVERRWCRGCRRHGPGAQDPRRPCPRQPWPPPAPGQPCAPPWKPRLPWFTCCCAQGLKQTHGPAGTGPRCCCLPTPALLLPLRRRCCYLCNPDTST